MEKLYYSTRTVNTSTDHQVNLVNHLFISPDQVSDTLFDGVHNEEVKVIKFPELARLYINEWAANKTNGQINKFIPEKKIMNKTTLVMVKICTLIPSYSQLYYYLFTFYSRQAQLTSRNNGTPCFFLCIRHKHCFTHRVLKLQYQSQ